MTPPSLVVALQRLNPEATCWSSVLPGKQVAGQLLDREPVERQVAVEGADDPVAKRPGLAEVVEVIAVGVGIAGRVEPVASAMLAPPGRVEQPGHQRFVSVGRGSFTNASTTAGSGGRPVRSRASRRASVRRSASGAGRRPFCLELRQHEPVDRVADPCRVLHRRQLGPLRGNERPVRLILGPVGDPALEHVFLRWVSFLVVAGGGIELLGILGVDPGDQLARFGVAGRDGAGLDGRLAAVEPQIGLAGGAVGPVAGEAVLGQDRPDVAVVFQPRSICGSSRVGSCGESQNRENSRCKRQSALTRRAAGSSQAESPSRLAYILTGLVHRVVLQTSG